MGQSLSRIVEPALRLIGLCLLKPGAITFRIDLQCRERIFAGFFVIALTVVIAAQVYVGRDESSLLGLIEGDGFLITRNGSSPVSQSFLSKSQSIPRFHVQRVDTERLFKFFSRSHPAVLNGE